ncbi:glycosyltransferase family 2 protein [Hyphomonas sp.]|uniref:glycosyltransferase family 2 protein n=1 Tax=Hyphomonas sp. TaxID=87 RepID=UPI003528F71A
MTDHQKTPAPTVSVILPTFNRAHLIADSIESLFQQTYPIAEILVVDDGSTDETEAVVSAFAGRVRYVRQENGGKNSAINTGLREVKGDLVWIMDDDDLAPPDALARLVAPFIADPSTAISYGALQKFREDPVTGEHHNEMTHPYPPEDGRSFFVRIMEDCYITGQPCMLVRRSSYEEIFPLPEKNVVSEDYAVLLLLSRRWSAVRVDGVTLLQRQHDGPRGPAEIRYAAESRNARWCEADTELLRKLLPDLSLGELVGRPGATISDPRERRQALFQNATIAARKKLWPMALAAVRDAVKEAPDAPLSDMDRLILGRMLGCRYGLDELLEKPEILDELRDAFAGLAEQRNAIACIADLLPYLMKVAVSEKSYSKAVGLLRLYVRLVGPFRGCQLLVTKAWHKFYGQERTSSRGKTFSGNKASSAH